MKKLVWLAMILLLLAVVVGCDDDDDDGLSSGDLNDPSLNLFMEEFDGVDEMNGNMLAMMLQFVDSIGSMEPDPAILKVTSPTDGTIEYHGTTKFWVVTTQEGDDEDTFNIVDSIQFRHGSVPVQWPKDDSLTEVRSYMTVTTTAGSSASGTIYQNLVATLPYPNADTVTFNGSGGIDYVTSYWDADGTDTTYFAIDNEISLSVTNLTYDVDNMWNESDDGEELACPSSGALIYTGDIDIEATGATTGHVTGTWKVTEVFSDGQVTFTVEHGNQYWTVTEDCD